MSGEFRGFDTFREWAFPGVHIALKREVVGDYSLLYTWEGSEPAAKPVLLYAHMDVVPVENEDAWTVDIALSERNTLRICWTGPESHPVLSPNVRNDPTCFLFPLEINCHYRLSSQGNFTLFYYFSKYVKVRRFSLDRSVLVHLNCGIPLITFCKSAFRLRRYHTK
jgi:hypothetical protein